MVKVCTVGLLENQLWCAPMLDFLLCRRVGLDHIVHVRTTSLPHPGVLRTDTKIDRLNCQPFACQRGSSSAFRVLTQRCIGDLGVQGSTGQEPITTRTNFVN